jgi:asparagine synthase (glutamine-hydrolysing)
MCGIAGQVRHDGGCTSRGLIEQMCGQLVHRGPDSRGLHLAPQAALGIQRLRVIDLATGDQPIYNEDKSVVVVLNGEIYNFAELRSQLERAGHRFATAGDTEVIVHLYEEHDLECVQALQGMFAFALWDERRQRLLLARDRVGKKPLFYSARRRRISFASELAALLADPEISREIDYQALDCYLAYQYIPAPMTAFAAVRKLPPASTLVFEGGSPRISRYWELDYSRKRHVSDPGELHDEIREGLRRATRRRMIADVPIGAFLSGGIDSSAVVAAMAEQSSQPVKTFSIGFEFQPFNELPFARSVARRFGTDHHEFVVNPDITDVLPKLVRHYGEPFADSSAIPSFYVSELTRRYVTVALNGDGGDESFGGYNRYASNAIASRFERLPRTMRVAAASAARHLPADGDRSSTRNRAKRLLESLSTTAPERYARHVSYFGPAERASAYTAEFGARVGTSLASDVIMDAWRGASGRSVVDKLMEVDVKTRLPDDLLVKMDIATMAHGLEARSPFLDPELMELGASIPASFKVRGTAKKIVLREALRGWVPDETLDRPKWGFSVPLAKWFREELREYLADVLFDPVTTSRGYFRTDAIRRDFDLHVQGRADNAARLWALLVLELWHREFVDRPGAM